MSEIENNVLQLEDAVNLLGKLHINLKKTSKSRLKPSYLQIKLQCVDEYWSIFRKAYNNLVKITTKAEKENLKYFKEDTYFLYEEQYITLKADILELLGQISPQQSTSQQSMSPPPRCNNITPDVKLPQINLPLFSGVYEEWQTFEDTFTSLIHNNAQLSNVQKLHYLKSCIVGEAKNVIKHLPITDKNYICAWDTLKGRYSHKRLIVNSILKKLHMQKKIISQSACQLKILIDTTKECLNCLENLDISTETWDVIIIFIIVQKLDHDTHKEWETYVSDQYAQELPKFIDLINFLENRIRTLELTNTTASASKYVKERTYTATATVEKYNKCLMCNENHILCHCKEFSKLSMEKRNIYVKDNRLCYNCLAKGHSVQFCRQKTTCKICGKRHHTLLHETKKRDSAGNNVSDHSPVLSKMHTHVEDARDEENLLITSHFTTKKHMTLLATAVVPVRTSDGQVMLLRALMDQGSQASFLSERAAQMLKLRKTPVNGKVTGVGSTNTTISHVVNLEVLSRYDTQFKLNVKAYVIPTQITTKLPSHKIHTDTWPHIHGLFLADPSYSTPGRVDILFGVDVFSQVLMNNLIKGPPGTPCAQETNLGWLLFGNIHNGESLNKVVVMHHQIDIDNMLRKMWEVETPDKRVLTAEERKCEEIYKSTYSRSNDGRYIVQLPFKIVNPAEVMGETKGIALKRFYNLERRFDKDSKLKEEYTKVIDDYIEQNHMEEVPKGYINNASVYLPHHAVRREDKETTKTRVVFDASCTSINNVSLNGQMLVGPQLQDDLRSLIMRWRTKKIAFLSDITAMYRQILVTKEDADLQRIVWRKNKDEDVKDYRLLRVTFGTAAAPYLAVRTLIQVADDEGQEYPDAAKLIKEDFYMDDLMSGHDTVQEALNLYQQITEVLKRGGFQLSKWASNNISFIEQIPSHLRTTHAKLNREVNGIMKALGLIWNMGADCLQYEYNLPEIPETVTKRNILADIQRLFDPLGWISPAIIPAKLLIQRLWLEKLTWDEKVSTAIEDDWLTIRNSFKCLEEVQIHRWLNTVKDNVDKITLHGFCDASEKAYAAVVYCRVITDGKIVTSIVAAKTRVAPVKPVSLPRLELCGAVLLSGLLKQVKEAMRLEPGQIYAWTDSTVVLSWLAGDPSRWKTFVSNRVVEILENTHNTQWYHVKSKDNPADVASRGILLSNLMECKQWWKGPEWLRNSEMSLENENIIPTTLEMKVKLQVNLKLEKNTFFENYTTLQELLKIVTLSRRFINSKKEPDLVDSNMTTRELEESLIKCIKIAQDQDYEDEIHRLKEKKYVGRNSNIKTLNPYIDEDGVLRVGGRLRQAKLDEEKKHPIILKNNNYFTQLIVAEAHKRTLHGGVQLMLAYLRSKYWIIRAKSLVKRCIHSCIICARQRATHRSQMMGDLPEVRVTPARAFLNSGIDFAGPFQILCTKGRGLKTTKAYIAVFICMATKAIHLELVGDLTSESFIGAFHRFVARRGRCTHLWSDQGRNFVAANKELAAAWKVCRLELPGDLAEILASDGTQWHFIPPYSPNFGGLWEAGVKSVKYHLRRILTRNLTFEEMTTILCEIEACLNSRPLCAVDNEADDIEPLTPGHFLIGEAPLTVPSPDLRSTIINKLSRWQHTQKLLREFWHRWQTEYLSRLQQRPKWLKREKEFEVGDIVLLREENLPPGKWALGRVVKKHPGQDDISRVYSVKCRGSVIQRSISKLSSLPISTD